MRTKKVLCLFLSPFFLVGIAFGDARSNHPKRSSRANTVGTLSRIRFISVAGTHNCRSIYKNAAPADWGDGTVIVGPEWHPSAKKNLPACYIKNTRMRVIVTIKINQAGQTFSLIGKEGEGETEYFRRDDNESSGGWQSVYITSGQFLPNKVGRLTKTFKWSVVMDGTTHDFGSSGPHTIYVLYANAIETVEAQTNRPTPKRLDFVIDGAASGLSNKITITDKFVEKVRNNTGNSYGGLSLTPRWKFWKYLPTKKNLDCHHRAVLAVSGVCLIGIQAYTVKCYATIDPVPAAAPAPYPANSSKNDYMSYYTGSRLKSRKIGADVHELVFAGNNFEGGLRVEDGSADDGNMWWTVWRYKQHKHARAYLSWYDRLHKQRWVKLDGTVVANVAVPALPPRVKMVGGPN